MRNYMLFGLRVHLQIMATFALARPMAYTWLSITAVPTISVSTETRISVCAREA